jgi:hypothetical protein
MREGDASTCFFHAKASACFRKSYIHRIQVDDEVFTEQQDKKDAILSYFQSLQGETCTRSFTLNLQAMGVNGLNLED